MRITIITLSFFLSFLFLSCSSENTVTIEEFIPQDEVANLSTFSIEFSKDLAPADLIDKWVDEKFLIFEPDIAGKFKWISANKLIFSPDFPLEPMQDYKAKVTEKVLFNSNCISDFDEYKFHTSDFDVTKVEFFWTQIPHESYKVSVQANIFFNYPVSPAEIKKYLEVSQQGKIKDDYTIQSEKPADVIAINFGEIDQIKDKQKLSVSIQKGLMSVLKKKALQQERKFEHELPPITELAITEVTSGFDDDHSWILVNTTQTVDEKRLKDYIEINPKKDFEHFVNENSFKIEGDFSDIQTASLIIKKGLPGLFGGTLQYDFEQDVNFVNLEPSINFADKRGIYLMRNGLRNIEVNSINIANAEVEISQVFDNNLLFFLNRYRYYYNDDYNRQFYPGEFGKNLYTEKIPLKKKDNWIEKFSINFDKLLNQPRKGIYVLNVRSAENRWIADAKIISLSDLGIIAKTSEDQIIVFVNSISGTEPVANAVVKIISSNNQVILSGETNSDGILIFENVKEKIADFSPRLITVEKDGDLNYLDYGQSYVETSRYDVGGVYEYSPDFSVFIYSERNLYRPGDKINLSAIVRNDKVQIVNEIPIIIKVITPTGKTFSEFNKTLNKEGSFELSYEIPNYAQTGEYVVEVYSGPKHLISSYKYSVEEFVPDKIRLNLKTDKSTANLGDIVSFDVNAEFLFGSKAAGLKYESEIQYNHRSFYSKNYPAFDFSNSSIKNANISSKFKEGTLDENGFINITDTIPGKIAGSGVVENTFYVSVFDLTGRTVNRSISLNIFPKKYFIGIKAPGYYFDTDERMNFKLIAVDENDKPINKFKGKAVLIRYEWQTVLQNDYSSRYYYESQKVEVKEWEKSIDISSGPKDFIFSVPHSGSYELRIFKEGDSDYQAKDFYAYGWGSSTASSFEVDKEGRVEIVTDKKVYEPGEKAKVLFTTPFSGKMLVTVERNSVYHHQYIEVNSKSAEVEISLPEDYMPNVYISATLFRKQDMTNSSPFLVGHGYASVKVEKKKNILPLTITATKKVKPHTRQEVIIKTVPEKDIYITLAAVDEGILQIKNFKTPDAYAYMYAKRSLKVGSYDLYKFLLPEVVALSSSAAGDGSDEEEKQVQKRTNPVTTKRIKLVSFFSGIRKSNSDGIVKINLDIPQFNGEIRLMALAYSGSRFGSAEEYMKVMDDLIIEPEMPRFLAPNDSLISTVTLINTTSSKVNINLTVKTDGPLKVSSAKPEKVEIKPNSTKQVNFGIKSGSGIGAAKITFETTGSAKVKEIIDIGVRPISPLFVESGSGIIKANDVLKVNIPTDYLKGTQNSTLTISRFPAIKFAKHLKYLVGYPHGCIEQTTSKLFPQLYFESLAKLVAPDLYKTNNPVYYVKEGIRKLESMQLYNGAMSYWQGGDYESWWGSVYAAHFLIEARKAGFAVSENVVNKLLAYIAKQCKEGGTYSYYTYSGNKETIKQVAYKEILYGLYVLALAGKSEISTMNYYKSHPQLLSADSKYLLAGAFALSKRWNTYYEIVPASFTPEITKRESGGNFDSEIRVSAIMLNVLLEVEPANPQIPYMIKHLSQLVDRMYSTQERSFTFLALGKAAAITADSNVKIDIISNGKVLNTFDKNDITVSGAQLNSKKIELKSKGKGEVYYFWSTEGIKLNSKVKESDSFMKVRRTFYDYRTGNIIENNFKQGQLIVCKIELIGTDRSAENIVITDLLPACFEIENPRLSSSTELRWKEKNPINVQYLDIRDDRLLLFTNVNRNYSKEFYYVLRVVNKGKFQLPVIGAEAMYDPEFHSYNGAGVIRVN